MSSEHDDRIDYIKDSLDKLHDKVDDIHEDVDVRLKSLELDRANRKGFMTAISVIGAVIGSGLTMVVNYVIYRK